LCGDCTDSLSLPFERDDFPLALAPDVLLRPFHRLA
jgi:hypothetical protein